MKAKEIIGALILLSLLITGCVKDEIFQGPPVISNLTMSPQIPSENQSVEISVKVADINAIKKVSIYYSASGGNFIEVAMTGSEGIYTGQIPGQASNVTVNYYIMAENISGQKAYHPAGAPQTTASFTIGAPLIVMNEIYSRGTVEEPDWIEIYNASDITVNIGNFAIYDNGGQSGDKPKLKIPEGTTIPAKGFYVVVTDIGGDSGFGLSSGGEEVWLENATGSIIDNVQFPAMNTSQSYGRIPDGAQNWELLNTITKGQANSSVTPDPTVLINEIFSRGTAEDPDWIEVYNDSNSEVNIEGWLIYDSGGNGGTKPKKAFPAGSIIPAKGFLVIVVDDADASGFGLSSNGEEVWLEKPGGTLADQVVFPALAETESYGRYPDGTANWQVLPTVTKGAPNSNVMPEEGRIVMNEIYSRGTTENPDWIEIYNDGNNEKDISGWLIYDSGGNGGTKPKKAFPAGSIIPAKGFLVIVVDDADASGFGLSSNGEEVWLEDANSTIIDQVVFPAMAETQSYGRKPDGSANWQLLEVITRGSSNGSK
jgi:hypothetical protein